MGQDIAVVDDEVLLGSLLAEVLGEQGYPARAFTSALGCLAAIDAGYRPGLIFVDLCLRGLSGAAFVRRVREDAGTAGAGVYVISGSTRRDDYPPAQDIQGVIAKPFDLECILGVARRRLGPPLGRAGRVAATG